MLLSVHRWWRALVIVVFSIFILPLLYLMALRDKIPVPIAFGLYIIMCVIAFVQGHLKQSRGNDFPLKDVEVKFLDKRAECLIKYGKYEAAVKDLNRLVQADKDNSNHYVRRAIAHEALKNIEEAKHDQLTAKRLGHL